MNDRAGSPAIAHPLSLLPRVWWIPSLPGYRSAGHATYVHRDLDDQPPVPAQADLGWLGEEADKTEWSIDAGGPVRALTLAGLEAVAGGLAVPSSLRLLAARPQLQRRIRSATACYLDLADFAAQTDAGNGYLIHVLSDQQWCLHWLVYLDGAGNEAVLASPQPLGFALPGGAALVPRVIPLGAMDLVVCADSFAEFLYRFWAENEIFFASSEGQPMAPAVAAYAACLPGPASSR